MQGADTVLEVLRDRGRRKLPLARLYRQLFNEQLFLIAYGRIYANDGAMTPGADGITPDGMSLGTIRDIIARLRAERYRFTPVRRVYIPKKNGTRRPLGLPTWTDKLVGEVVRLLLEAYYEPQFSARSHGFRTGRGCHTALEEIASTWTGTTWFIEGDIADCFGSLNHEVMLAILAEQVQDKRFLQLVENMLKAGYLEDWTWHATHSGAPQGGVISPILSNIYLDRLDTFVEKELAPAWTRGTVRRRNREYGNVTARIGYWKRKGDREKVKVFRRIQQTIPSIDVHDPDYRRLRYVRYADDHLLGFAGTKAEAEQIKNELAAFLRDNLKLDLSTEKTLITHARTHKARFLGYDIWTRQVAHQGRPVTQRFHRPGRATGSRQRPMSLLPAETGQTPDPQRPDPHQRLQHRRCLWHGISRLRPVLPVGRQHQLAQQAPRRHGTIDDVDPGSQAPSPAVGDAPPLPNHRRHPARETPVFRSDPARPVRRGVHRQVRRDPATSSQTCPSDRRSMADATGHTAHRPAHRRDLRALRLARRDHRPPCQTTRRPQPIQPDGRTTMGARHAGQPTEDPDRLRPLPQHDP
jgi:group II intron reverse transcriptase/maturase